MKTITQKEWKATHRNYKGMIDGKPYLLVRSDQDGTTLAPVKVIKDKKWVCGNRDGKWYLVDEKDRDFKSGISQVVMNQVGREKAKRLYFTLNN